MAEKDRNARCGNCGHPYAMHGIGTDGGKCEGYTQTRNSDAPGRAGCDRNCQQFEDEIER